jgi:hypothetical protein
LIEAGAARFAPVESGLIGGLDVVVEGVDAGRLVVSGPYQSLRELQDGRPVRVDPGG